MTKIQKITFFVWIAWFGFLGQALAVTTFTLTFHLTNPGPDAAKVTGRFTLPDCLEPQNLTPEEIWDPATRILRAPIGALAAGETATIPIEVQITQPTCDGTATVEGEYSYSESFHAGGGGTELAPLPGVIPEQPSVVGGVSGGGAGGGGPLGAINRAVDGLRENPQVVTAVNQAVSPVALVASALSTVVVFTNVFAAGSHILFSWLDYARFLFFGFIKKRSKVPWGRVYNDWTKIGIAGAKVSVVETTFQKTKEIQITDAEGRFGFLVAPGNYYLNISKGGFEPKQTPPFDVGEDVASLNLAIGLMETREPPRSVGSLFSKLIQVINEFLYSVNPYVLAAGTALSAGALLVVPSTLNLVVLIAYGVLDVLKVIFSSLSAKSYGLVIDRQTRRPLALTVVRLFDADSNRLVGTRVTDDKGRFTFLTLPGQYYLTCNKGNYSELKTNPVRVSKANLFTQTLELSTLPPAV